MVKSCRPDDYPQFDKLSQEIINEKRKRFSKLFGMLENSNLSTKEFCKQKQIDKELDFVYLTYDK